MGEGDEISAKLTGEMSMSGMTVKRIAKCYVLPPSQRPNSNLSLQPSNPLPVMDLASLHHPSNRAQLVSEIDLACRETGFFQVINHGISTQVTEAALETASDLFNLPMEEKMLLMSDDVNKAGRYGTSVKQMRDDVHFWRDFLKHYSNPLPEWVDLWPSNPHDYREKMGKYAEEVQQLAVELMGVIMESLGLQPDYLKEEIEGTQVMAVNCYPACPEPELTLGMPPHSDYVCLTILLQTCQGLEVMDKDKKMIPVQAIEGALLVHVGDHLEVISNGKYKGVIHRAMVNCDKQRLSIASLHSLSMDKKVSTAPELVDKHHPVAYNSSSFAEFLHYLSSGDALNGKRYIETLKKRIREENVGNQSI